MKSNFAYKDRDWLYDQYWNNKLNLREIGELGNVSLHTIRNWMIRFDIPRRTSKRLDKDCGRKVKYLPGMRFGRLVILSKALNNAEGRSWLCLCDCGKEKIVSGRMLSSGNAKSCGCLRDETLKENIKRNAGANKKDYGEARFNDLYLSYKRSAKNRKLEFSLPKEYFRELTKGSCFYCGIEPQQIVKAGNNVNGEYIYNGIDRINNNVGYIKGNCRSCCKYCNAAKGTMSNDEFMDWINKIYNYYLLPNSARFEFGESG